MEGVKKGFLGFPIYSASDDLYPGWSYDNAVEQWVNDAMSGINGSQVLERFQQDPRVKELVGKFVTGFSSTFSEKFLAEWWLFRANEVGKEIADQDVENYLNGDVHQHLSILWVHGLEPDNTIELFDDYWISTVSDIPDSTDKQSILPSKWVIPDSPIKLALPKAAIVRRGSTPKLIPEFGDLPSGDSRTQEVRIPVYELCLLLNCMPGVTCIAGHHNRRSLVNFPFGVLHYSARNMAFETRDVQMLDLYKVKSNALKVFDKDLFEKLYRGFNSLNQKNRKRIILALKRFAQAKIRTDYQDAALDLGIVLEMLLLYSEHRGGDRILDQLSLHFRLRGAWLIGSDPEERKEMYKLLNQIYNQRSKVAHNGYSEDLDKLSIEDRKVRFGQQFSIAERIFRALIINGQPNWTALVLGEP